MDRPGLCAGEKERGVTSHVLVRNSSVNTVTFFGGDSGKNVLTKEKNLWHGERKKILVTYYYALAFS